MQQDRLLKGYEWKTLGEISLSKGQYGSGASKSSFNGKVRYIRITDIDDNGNLKENEIVSPSEIEEEYFLENNDLLFARSGSVGRTYIHNEKDKLKYQFAGYLIRFKINPNIAIAKYVYYFTKSKFYKRWINSFKKNVTLSNINAKEYASLKVPILPIQIQNKIISVLEKAEKLKERRKITNEETDKILQNIFYDTFGDPIRNNKDFPIKKLNEICEIIMGQSPRGSTYNSKSKGTPFFQGKAEFNYKYPKVAKWTTNPLKLAKVNDILMSVRAPVGPVNMCNIDCCIGRGIAAIRAKKEIHKEYLFTLLQLIKKNIEILGSGSTFKAITTGQLRNLGIQVPPIKLQNKFAEQVQKIDKIKQNQEKSEEEINTLFDSLIQKAFKGELVK